MKIKIKPGSYVVAVSGGVDSMVLLDLLRQQPKLDLIVAHYNHGIRPDSVQDEKLVKEYCIANDLLFVTERGNLGKDSSEAKARQARYEFLEEVKTVNLIDAIVTAHHADDVLETAIINLMRGTRRRGLSSLKETDEVKRPLLPYSKKEIIDYAKANNIKWNEDSSNQDNKYLRNYVRNQLIPMAKKGDPEFEKHFSEIINDVKLINQEADELVGDIANIVCSGDKTIDREKFRELPTEVQAELIRYLLGKLPGKSNITADHIERICSFIDLGKNKKTYDLSKDWQIILSRSQATITGN